MYEFTHETEVDKRGLPNWCFIIVNTTDEVAVVHRDVAGYSPTREGNQPWRGQETADTLNAKRGINKAQAEAMKMGSMFGWNIPAANPAKYDPETGRPL